MSLIFRNIRLIAIDADDTLWETQPFFDKIEEWYCSFLSKYANQEFIGSEFFKRECYNMEKLGYGSKAFIISLVENAISVTNGNVKPSELMEIIEKGRSLIDIPATPLEGVEETLKLLREKIMENNLNVVNIGSSKERENENIRERKKKGDSVKSEICDKKVKMIIFTKGDSKEQEVKIFRSGLLKYFDDYRVYSEKREEDYFKLIREFGVEPENFIMIGNSFKSDIEPVLKIGGRAIHIPFYAPWKYELTDEYDHPHLIKILHFNKLNDFIFEIS